MPKHYTSAEAEQILANVERRLHLAQCSYPKVCDCGAGEFNSVVDIAIEQTAELEQLRERYTGTTEKFRIASRGLRRFGKHLDSCAYQDDVAYGCDCGLHRALMLEPPK